MGRSESNGRATDHQAAIRNAQLLILLRPAAPPPDEGFFFDSGYAQSFARQHDTIDTRGAS